MTFTAADLSYIARMISLAAWGAALAARIPRQCGGQVPDFEGTATLVRRRK